MPREITYIGQQELIDDYLECHYFENQKHWACEGVPLNPVLREDFDGTPNEEREALEIEHWWNKPYITTHTYSPETYSEYVSRLSKYRIETKTGEIEKFELETESQFNERIEKGRVDFLKYYPSGTAYDIHCLNGGAWDRPTWIGSSSTLEAAITTAQGYINSLLW